MAAPSARSASAATVSSLGVLDIRDALQAMLEDEEYQERVLVDYISGVGCR